MNIHRTSQVITAGILVMCLGGLACGIAAQDYLAESERDGESRRRAAGSDRLTHSFAFSDALATLKGTARRKGIPEP